MPEMQREGDEVKLTYADKSHAYYLDGKRATSVTGVAKIPIDSSGLEAVGQAHGRHRDGHRTQPGRERRSPHRRQKSPRRDLRGGQTQSQKPTTKLTEAPRNTGCSSSCYSIREDKLLTDQQRADAVILKRTMDRYHLTPYDYMTEQFVAWPHYWVTGRFDAVLERPDGSLCLVDLKSGSGAIDYPLQTEIQLALYGRAPYISDNINFAFEKGARKAVVTDWREMPERLDRRYAYVMLVEDDSEVGTLHEMDIEHGWAGAQLALNALEWRKKYNRGKDTVREVTEWEHGRRRRPGSHWRRWPRLSRSCGYLETGIRVRAVD